MTCTSRFMKEVGSICRANRIRMRETEDGCVLMSEGRSPVTLTETPDGLIRAGIILDDLVRRDDPFAFYRRVMEHLDCLSLGLEAGRYVAYRVPIHDMRRIASTVKECWTAEYVYRGALRHLF